MIDQLRELRKRAEYLLEIEEVVTLAAGGVQPDAVSAEALATIIALRVEAEQASVRYLRDRQVIEAALAELYSHGLITRDDIPAYT